MSCYGISVANGKIANLEESTRSILAGLDTQIIDKVITALMTSLKYKVSGDRGYYTVTGNGYEFYVDVRYGQVKIRSYGIIPQGFEDQIKALLDGLAGRVRQQQVINQLTKAGVKIDRNTTASNGAVVLSVRL